MSVPVLLLWVPTFPSIREWTCVVTSSHHAPLRIKLSLALPAVGKAGSHAAPTSLALPGSRQNLLHNPRPRSDRARASMGPHSSLLWDELSLSSPGGSGPGPHCSHRHPARASGGVPATPALLTHRPQRLLWIPSYSTASSSSNLPAASPGG